MIRLEDVSILEQDAKDEYTNPLPQKQIDERTIYLSRNNYGKLRRPTGMIAITDFDLSVTGDVPRAGSIQVDIFRAPEVILGAGYTYAADIWNLGVMVRLLRGLMISQAFAKRCFSKVMGPARRKAALRYDQPIRPGST